MSRALPGSLAVSAVGAAAGIAARLLRFAITHPGLLVRRCASFPRRMLAVRRIVRDAMSPASLDELLWAFRGYHTDWSDPDYRARRWDKVRLVDIGPSDCDGMPVEEMAAIMSIAMEIEDPIPLYSRNSGDGFRYLLPTLARYTGMNAEQAAYAKAHGLPWCESSWCEEERRHAPSLARAIARLTGAPAPACKPNEVAAVTNSEEGSLRLLASRQATELGSSATYFVLAAHARGVLHGLMVNLARDEVKHLAILSAADTYLLGPRPWGRPLRVSRVMARFIRHHESHRTSGGVMSGNIVTGAEILMTMALEEWYLRPWLAGLGLPALALIFETPSTLPVLSAFEPGPTERAAIERRLVVEAARRARLARWSRRAAAGANAARREESLDRAGLDEIIALQLRDFAGAGEIGSRADRAMRRRISRLPLEQFAGKRRRAIRVALSWRLREKQLRANRSVRARQGEPRLLGEATHGSPRV